jgi:predicted TIM-barrel fold metal-dependent hydrolase
MRRLYGLALLAQLVCSSVQTTTHLFSPADESMLAAERSTLKTLDAAELIRMLDAAGIRRAVVLSVAYMYAAPRRHFDDEYARVVRENDWTAAQVAQFPGRLRAFCAFNPLKLYALDELERRAADPNLRTGIKLHFGNSDVQLDSPEHVEALRLVFKAANNHRMAIAIHMRASIAGAHFRRAGPADGTRCAASDRTSRPARACCSF